MNNNSTSTGESGIELTNSNNVTSPLANGETLNNTIELAELNNQAHSCSERESSVGGSSADGSLNCTCRHQYCIYVRHVISNKDLAKHASKIFAAFESSDSADNDYSALLHHYNQQYIDVPSMPIRPTERFHTQIALDVITQHNEELKWTDLLQVVGEDGPIDNRNARVAIENYLEKVAECRPESSPNPKHALVMFSGGTGSVLCAKEVSKALEDAGISYVKDSSKLPEEISIEKLVDESELVVFVSQHPFEYVSSKSRSSRQLHYPRMFQTARTDQSFASQLKRKFYFVHCAGIGFQPNSVRKPSENRSFQMEQSQLLKINFTMSSLRRHQQILELVQTIQSKFNGSS